MAAPRKPARREKAYLDHAFLESSSARPLRILAEYLEPKRRFDRHNIDDTIVFMGSARIVSREAAEAAMSKAGADRAAKAAARRQLAMSRYYEEARELARRLTVWSKGLGDENRRFVVCTGGGPGIMEAANRGASEAGGLNVGLGISLPAEQADNAWVTRELAPHFHYFFMRKFWFAYLAKALIVFPGGFGTFDELFEILTLLQTRKITKHLPIVLYGTEFWNDTVNFDALVSHGMIAREDLGLFMRTSSVDEAYDFVVRSLEIHGIHERGAVL